MLTFYQNLKPHIAKKYRNKLMLQWWAVKQLLKGKLRLRNTFGDEIRVKDEITCWQGDKLQFRTKGHIVSYGLMLMVNYLSFAGTSSATAAYGMMYSWYIRCGTGTGATGQATIGLVTINSTAPNTMSGTNSNPSTGQYRIAWTATWNSGTLSAITITEFGMWWNNGFAGSPTVPSLTSFGSNYIYQSGGANTQFASRISSTDGDFTSFTVNTSVPLTLQWNLTFTFA